MKCKCPNCGTEFFPPRPRKKKVNVRTRFFDMVDFNGPIPKHCPELGPCHLWRGKLSDNRYGQFTIGSKAVFMAHRFAWMMAFGKIPDGQLVRHKCDEGHCVNPAHLCLGTQLDNMRDMKERGRERKASGESNGSHKLTATQVLQIKRTYHRYRVTQSALGRQFKVDRKTIARITQGRGWKHVTT